MGIDIEKAKVIEVQDEHGIYHFGDYYSNLAELANQHHEDKVKFQFLFKTIRRLRTVDKRDLPRSKDNKMYFDFEIDVDGQSYSRSLEVVKQLGKAPVYELRINIKEFDWRFRATFFPQYNEGQLYYCIAYPFEKVDESPDDGAPDDPTDHFRDLTYSIYMDSRLNPDKYFK